MRDFLHCVRGRGTPKCPVDEAFIETATYLMLVEFYKQKRLVRWDAVNEEIASRGQNAQSCCVAASGSSVSGALPRRRYTAANVSNSWDPPIIGVGLAAE